MKTKKIIFVWLKKNFEVIINSNGGHLIFWIGDKIDLWWTGSQSGRFIIDQVIKLETTYEVVFLKQFSKNN
jgi:hypothetical protein